MNDQSGNLSLLIIDDDAREVFEKKSNFQLDLLSGSVKKAMNGAKSSDLWMCPIDDIVIMEGFNVRSETAQYREKVEKLANSIIENGFYKSKPLAIFVGVDAEGKNVNYLYDGHRRYAAAKLAISRNFELPNLPCVTSPAGTSLEDLTIAMVTMNDGDPVDPFGVAIVCNRMIKGGTPIEEIARRLMLSPTYVKDLLTMMAAPRALRNLVSEGHVSATLAISTIKKHGTSAPAVLQEGVEKAKAQGKTRVTGKTLAPEKVKTIKPEKRDLLQVATDWLARNADLADKDKRVFELAALLCEVSPNEVEGRYAFKLKDGAQPDATNSPAKSSGKEQLALAPEILT
ncbi:ParB/RepB/Spo0J family partition protein [Polaromonas naphthalenivorans]|uniref:ParB domain protein nuclease n=1 Tax=Polaromonas naphthalenivorans (strain CJ2) TaxID=365044 RepID=A1VVC1_POLNA|nr:hypothetical protein [Polaromonas naphthalenivorans]ABM39599.1 hypothetical protein Pnap_4317 [Polaromonas naphthalenivorans CJ2]